MALVIETARLRQKPEQIRGKEPASLLEMELGELIRPESPLSYDLTAQRVSGELIVRGTLKINFVCHCARCGVNFSKNVFIPDFCRSFPLTSKNELINLTTDVREDILLALPMVATCSDDCRGLCGGCGADLNREKCRCKHRDQANAWRILNGLRLQ